MLICNNCFLFRYGTLFLSHIAEDITESPNFSGIVSLTLHLLCVRILKFHQNSRKVTQLIQQKTTPSLKTTTREALHKIKDGKSELK